MSDISDALNALEERLVEVEVRVAHQDAAIETLTQTLLEKDQLLRQLRTQLETLEQQMRLADLTGVADASQEPPPPHY
ncbi:MAG: hypothetical protein Kow006_23140 [Gammaproteobacteria bacterium]